METLLKINCSMAAISAFGVTQHSQIVSVSLETEFNALRFISYTIPRLFLSTYAVATIVALLCYFPKPFYSLSPGVWQSFVTIRSCNHLMRIISTMSTTQRKVRSREYDNYSN